MKLFISYSRQDSVLVYKLAEDLTRHDVWIDREQIVGSQKWWTESICVGIENCECFVPIFSVPAVASIYCQAELEYALSLGKPILPVMIQSCTYPKSLNDRQLQHIDVPGKYGGNYNLLLREISESLSDIRAKRMENGYAEITPDPKKRPPVPRQLTATDAPNLLGAISKALAADEFERSADLLIQLEKIGTGFYLEWAKDKRAELEKAKLRKPLYEQVWELAQDAKTLPDARKLWAHYKEQFDDDPYNVASLLEAAPKPTPPQISIVTPPRLQERGLGGEVKNALEAALDRARNFSGKHNADWQPYITTFPELKIPDMQFCLVPGGTFQMGSADFDNAQPVHPQTLKPYWIARYPVTNAQWRLAVVAKAVAEPKGDDAKKWYKAKNMADAPVVGVTWFAAQNFCEWLGVRLPTEPKWEFAARGVDGLNYPWGNNFILDNVVFSENSRGKPHPVTSKPEGKSWIGAMHLSGNVWEWCSSSYLPYPYDAKKAESDIYINEPNVLRGGSFDSTSNFLRVVMRVGVIPIDAVSNGGFRCSFSLK